MVRVTFTQSGGIHSSRGYTLSFRWTGNARAALLQSTHFCFYHPRYGQKISRAVRSYKGCLEIPTVVDLTTESASVRASTVSHSHSTMCWKPFLWWVCFWVHSMSENAQYSCVSCPANTLCWISSESEALTRFYTAWVVSTNLALLGKQYSFELEGTLGVQDPEV